MSRGPEQNVTFRRKKGGGDMSLRIIDQKVEIKNFHTIFVTRSL